MNFKAKRRGGFLIDIIYVQDFFLLIDVCRRHFYLRHIFKATLLKFIFNMPRLRSYSSYKATVVQAKLNIC